MDYYNFFGNNTDDDFASQLKPASDLSVDAVMASLYFNLIVCAVLMASYEILRRLLPSVYAARRQSQQAQTEGVTEEQYRGRAGLYRAPSVTGFSDASLLPLNWVAPIFGVSWAKIRKVAGLDGYFFLRYIRMCVRITSVSSFWAAVILVPVYLSGSKGAQGWYHLSMNNIEGDTWRMWIPVIFMYLFSAFCFFVMKQEYRHFIEVRMDFLGSSNASIHPQQPFSVFVENIPLELRSDRALFEYFNKLFPGKVHSASVLLSLPDLENMNSKRLRTVHRLEKSIAFYKATGKKPTHIMGRNRIVCCGIHMAPLDCSWSKNPPVKVDMEGDLPDRGTRVDDISYYTRDLADCNRDVYLLQQQKTEVAQSGNVSVQADNWWTKIMHLANQQASEIMEESLQDNDLQSPTEFSSDSIPQVDMMKSRYGSLGISDLEKTSAPDQSSLLASSSDKKPKVSWSDDLGNGNDDKTARLVTNDRLAPIESTSADSCERDYIAPGGRKEDRGCGRRMAGRLGLDFAVAGVKYFNRHLGT
jgi:hypothetical protein